MNWTNEEIDFTMLNRWQGTFGTSAIDSPSYRVAVEVATQIAVDLKAQLAAAQQRMAELEEDHERHKQLLAKWSRKNDALAQKIKAMTWEPVPLGIVFGIGDGRIWAHGDRQEKGDGWLTIDAPGCHVELGPDVRLCHRRQAQEGGEG